MRRSCALFRRLSFLTVSLYAYFLRGEESERRLILAAKREGVVVEEGHLLTGLMGPKRREVWVIARKPRVSQMYTLFHEAAHVLTQESWRDEAWGNLRALPGMNYGDAAARLNAAGEIIADQVASGVLSELGLLDAIFA